MHNVLPPVEVLVVLWLAAFRATRLLTRDAVTDTWRDKLFNFAWDTEHLEVVDGAERPTARAPWRTQVWELFTCQWCLGVWLSAAAWAAWYWGGRAALAVLVILAVAGAQGVLAQLVRTIESEDE